MAGFLGDPQIIIERGASGLVVERDGIVASRLIPEDAAAEAVEIGIKVVADRGRPRAPRWTMP